MNDLEICEKVARIDYKDKNCKVVASGADTYELQQEWENERN